MNAKRNDKRQKKYSLLDSILLPFQAAPGYVLLIVLLDTVIALVPLCNTYAVSGFINHTLDFLSGRAAMRLVTASIAAMILILLVKMLAGICAKLFATKLSYRLKETLQSEILLHKARLAYPNFEDDKTCDLIERAGKDVGEKVFSSFQNITGMIGLGISIGSILVVLTAQLWWAGIVILAIAVPLLALAVKSGKTNYQVGQEVTNKQRRFRYLQEVLLHRDYVSERELGQYSEHFQEEYRETYEDVRRKECKVKRKWFVKLKIGGTATSMLSYAVVIVLLPAVIHRTLSIGMYLALVGSILELVSFLSWQLTAYMDTMAKDTAFYAELTQLMSLTQEGPDTASDVRERLAFSEIEFREVHFSYPDQEHEVLKGVNLKIENGKSYSFVGINGAGKTTIVKLLIGLYKNYTGEILVDGKELKTFAPAQLRGLFGCIFQDFCKYEIPLEENVTLATSPGEAGQRLSACLKDVGLADMLRGLPNGSRTKLGKLDEDGIDLSGGEWQKVALARALYPNVSVLILDEPTASMDPMAEYKIYALFKELLRSRTTLMISHRLGSAMMADHIFVLADGRIAEQGNHDALVKRQGIYADMFRKQKRWYENEDS